MRADRRGAGAGLDDGAEQRGADHAADLAGRVHGAGRDPRLRAGGGLEHHRGRRRHRHRYARAGVTQHLFTSADPWPSTRPDALEAIDVHAEHVAARDLLEMHRRASCGGSPIDTLGGKDLVIGAVDEVVQLTLM
jgi:hypothetical protein